MAACNQRKKKEEEGNKTVIAGFLFESRSGDRREARKEGKRRSKRYLPRKTNTQQAGRWCIAAFREAVCHSWGGERH